MSAGQRYAKLMTIAKETSSEKRRELLREVTDMFFEEQVHVSPVENQMFGELMAKVAFELDHEVRRELSSRFDNGLAPRHLAVALANDEIDVASPILRSTKSFTDSDLISIVSSKPTEYQIAVSSRPMVSEAVSDALVTHGNDEVVASLLKNEGAKISNDTYEVVVERAENSEILHEPFVKRKSVPPEYLNQLYDVVSSHLKKEIMDKNSMLSPEEFEKAMTRAKTRVSVTNGALPEDFEKMQRKLEHMKAMGSVSPAQLPNIWRDGKTTLFYLMFAYIVGIDYQTVYRTFQKKDIDGIAMLCRAKKFDRALFVTLAVFVLGKEAMKDAEKLGKMYNDVPFEAAGRALRFMQVRSSSMKAAA